MKSGLVLATLWIATIGAAGCANLQPPAPPQAPPPAPEQVQVSLQFAGVLVSIYHPDTRTVYLWSGDPRQASRRPMNCVKLQLSDTPSGAPKAQPCQ